MAKASLFAIVFLSVIGLIQGQVKPIPQKQADSVNRDSVLRILNPESIDTILRGQAQDSLDTPAKRRRAKKNQKRQNRKDVRLQKLLDRTAEVNPLAPSKAAFYSALVPGLGQIYNKRYWKLPIVYGAMGTGIYAYTFNNTQYNRYRDAFKSRRAGFTTDEFWDINGNGTGPDLSDAALQDAQERFQADRDLSLLLTILMYALNVIDANVDAHLKQYNVNERLSWDFRPQLYPDPVFQNPVYGISLEIKF